MTHRDASLTPTQTDLLIAFARYGSLGHDVSHGLPFGAPGNKATVAALLAKGVLEVADVYRRSQSDAGYISHTCVHRVSEFGRLWLHQAGQPGQLSHAVKIDLIFQALRLVAAAALAAGERDPYLPWSSTHPWEALLSLTEYDHSLSYAVLGKAAPERLASTVSQARGLIADVLRDKDVVELTARLEALRTVVRDGAVAWYATVEGNRGYSFRHHMGGVPASLPLLQPGFTTIASEADRSAYEAQQEAKRAANG